MSQPSNLVTVTQKRYRCRHVHAAGHQCGSPALRNEEFCYFHHTTRRPKPPADKSRHLDAHEPFELPIVEDLPSALSVAAQLLCRIASNDLDHERAGKLLYNLQIITSIIDKASRAAAKAGAVAKPEPLEELVADEVHGLIAPITEFSPAAPLTADAPKPATPTQHAYTEEEDHYFIKTVFSRGYVPQDEYPRPASVTDDDICAYANKIRRLYRLPPLEPHKDADGRLLSIHELGDVHTIPAVAPQPATDSPQTATLPTLNAATERRTGRAQPRSSAPGRRRTRPSHSLAGCPMIGAASLRLSWGYSLQCLEIYSTRVWLYPSAVSASSNSATCSGPRVSIVMSITVSPRFTP